MGSTATSDYRRRRKENLIKVCGAKCNICGYNKSNSALEFHHINPKEKAFGIAANGTCRDLETDLAEVKKCILVCANCHREIHNGEYEEDLLYQKQIFDENIAETLRKEKQQTVFGQKFYCKECGVEITRYSKSGFCEKCIKKTQRISERPSRDELKDLIRTKPYTEIGKMFNVSDKAISKWCKSENLPYRKKDINALSDAQWSLV